MGRYEPNIPELTVFSNHLRLATGTMAQGLDVTTPTSQPTGTSPSSLCSRLSSQGEREDLFPNASHAYD